MCLCQCQFVFVCVCQMPGFPGALDGPGELGGFLWGQPAVTAQVPSTMDSGVDPLSGPL